MPVMRTEIEQFFIFRIRRNVMPCLTDRSQIISTTDALRHIHGWKKSLTTRVASDDRTIPGFTIQ